MTERDVKDMLDWCKKKTSEEQQIDRLTKLLEEAPPEYEKGERAIAEHLFERGVIAPPCKVGDMLFALWSVPTEAKYVIYSAEVVEIRISGRNSRQTTTFLLEPLAYRGRRKEYRIDDFGKLVFTNKEEAEQALRKEDEVK